MRLVVISDLHGDKDTLGVPRLEEVKDACWQAQRTASIEKADAYVCLGDLTDPDSGGVAFQTIDMFGRVALRNAEQGIETIIIAGNHDVFEDGSGATSLTPLWTLAAHSPLIHVVEQPRVVWLKNARKGAFLCLPFTAASHAYEPAEFARSDWPDAEKVIVLGHLMVPGIVPGEETEEMPRGREVAFPVRETERAALRLNGHYHKGQVSPDGIVIPGAPARFTFGEQNHLPRFLVIDV